MGFNKGENGGRKEGYDIVNGYACWEMLQVCEDVLCDVEKIGVSGCVRGEIKTV